VGEVQGGRELGLRGDHLAHADTFRWVEPVAGAIAFVESDLPIPSGELIDLGQDAKGIRFGFGFDIEHTMKALERVDRTLADLV
jgi:hypothetical protein